MGLQDEATLYLTKYGITKIHMAKVIGIYPSQLSAWLNKKLVLSKNNVNNIEKYINTLRSVDNYLQEKSLVL
ncbi:hypothetical protein [Lacrimispora indolis]|uniref:hypothetical protein n=1 Tax=Lacrimispora indolis TaxID=69825 RepID=UPI000422F8BA|nr:hypothetical protein [[Clostridium] methoxybenzovorans]